MAAYQWLTKRWPAFFAALEQAETEQDVKRICEEEFAEWRARPGLKSEDSLRRPLTDTHNEIKRRLQGERLAWTIMYLGFSTDKWIELNTRSRKNLEQRLENQQLLKDPDKIVEVATSLLASQEWSEIAAGLAVTTGRRLVEVLKVGDFEHHTMYSVIFAGQAKRQESELEPFEIPTLCPSATVLNAVERLRLLLDTTDIDERTVSQKYSPAVKQVANQHFSTLIPCRDNKTDLYTHICRSVYARIAVYYYCPPTIADVHFMATVQGHYKQMQGSEELRRSYESNPSYADYKIAAADGNIDGRQGLHLGMAGVELLDVFKPKPRKATKQMDTEVQDEKKPKGKNHPITVTLDTYDRYIGLRTRLGHAVNDKMIVLLLDSFEEKEHTQLAASLTPDVFADSDVSAEDIQKFLEEGEDMLALLKRLVKKEAHFQRGLDKRHTKTDYSKFTTKQLSNIKDAKATFERIRRAVQALAAYNDTAVMAERWFINPRMIQQLSGARYELVNKYFTEHQSEINALNEAHKLNQKFNSKPYKITSVEALTKAYAELSGQEVAEEQ
jgi:hypothetical protein